MKKLRGNRNVFGNKRALWLTHAGLSRSMGAELAHTLCTTGAMAWSRGVQGAAVTFGLEAHAPRLCAALASLVRAQPACRKSAHSKQPPSIHALFEPFMPEKAHENCVQAFAKRLSFDQNASLGYFSAFANSPPLLCMVQAQRKQIRTQGA
jgi:hypothetical protein